jgi:YesN/AraC family two-component response regulator
MSENIHILFVDDEVDLEALVKQRFRKQIKEGNIRLSFALNGSEALKKITDDTTIGIVVTDINMPVMDGLSLVKRAETTAASIESYRCFCVW